MPETPPPKNQRDFIQIVKIGISLSMALMAGFLLSLKKVHPHIELRFGLETIAAFLLAGGISWRFCTILARADEGKAPGQQRLVVRWMVGFIGLASIGTIAAFGYALKDVSSRNRWDVIEGTVIAVAVLAIGGWLIFKAFKFFEEQSEIELEQQRQNHEREREREREQDED